MRTIAKTFGPYPFAHRQPKHDGHCQLVHGHSWYFTVTMAAEELDGNGFIYDFGKMQPVKEWLARQFDHTLVLAASDPHLAFFMEMETAGLCRLTLVDNPSAEALAEYVFKQLFNMFARLTQNRVKVILVCCAEEANSVALYGDASAKLALP